MTISANDRRKNYKGNGVATSFTGPRCFSPLHIAVFLGTADGSSTEVPRSQYTVRNAGGAGSSTVVMATPPANDVDVLILRTVPFDQPTDITNQGAFLPELHEDSFDYRAMQVQQLDDRQTLTIRFPETYPGALPDLTLPEPEPGKGIGWNYDGTGIRYITLEGAGDLTLRDDLADPTGGAALVAYSPGITYPSGTVGSVIKSLAEPLQQIVVLSSGQSNMPQDVAFDWDPEPNLFLWDYNSNYQDSDVVGTQFVPAPATAMGPSLVAANTIARENPRARVYVINIHRGGLGLINWSDTPTDYNFRQAIEGNVAAALALIGKDEVDHFVWGGCESDANAQSQTIQPDLENWLFSWLKTHTWFNAYTPIYIFGMSPYAQSAADNGDFLWKRYNNALRAAVSTDSSSRAYIGLENFPIQYFDPTGILPYIHRTPLGYFKSGEKLGVAIQRGIFEPCPRLEDTDGLYTPDVTNVVQCSVEMGYAAFTRIGNNIRVTVLATVSSLIAGDIGFDINVPVKVKLFPNNVMGTVASNIGASGVIIPLLFTNTVRIAMRAPVGVQTVVADFMYRVNSSDALPNSPPGTT